MDKFVVEVKRKRTQEGETVLCWCAAAQNCSDIFCALVTFVLFVRFEHLYNEKLVQTIKSVLVPSLISLW